MSYPHLHSQTMRADMTISLGKIRLLFIVALLFLSFHQTAGATGGIDPADPMVRITYAKSDLDIQAVLAGVSRDVTASTGIEERFITYYWQTFDAIQCMGKPATDKPLFVDLYVPGFFTDEQVSLMMTAIADSLEKRTGVDKEWVFIHTHFPLQGQVYISGHVEHWDNYRGSASSNPRDIALRAPGKFLFNDASFVFQSLWRFGISATGGADLGELLTITSRIRDFDHESWYTSWTDMACRVRAWADAFAKAGHTQSAKEAYLRATTYFRASEIYLPHQDPRGLVAWQNGRDTFLKAADLSEGLIEYVRIPYENTSLPGYMVKVDNSPTKRPLLIIQTGLDGTAEDLYFIMAAQAVKRGYNCLVFEGPGQGEMIRIQGKGFRHDWEKVITPVVDFALTRPEVDTDRLALIGYSMGGYLVPRALAFEKRVRWCVVDGGVYNVFDGTISKFPEEVQQGLGSPANRDGVDKLVFKEMEDHPDVSQFINMMLWTFQADSPYDLLKKLQKYTQESTIDHIDTETLVVNSSHDQIAGSNAQAKQFYKALKATKSYLEVTPAHGAQFHCQNGAPVFSSERILNWLDNRARP